MTLTLVDTAAVLTTAELAQDIYQSLAAAETHKAPQVDLIDAQPDLRWSMRPRLLGFLMEAQEVLRLQPGTLFLAVSILDRYASRRVIYARHYQLVGCVSLWLAAKFLDDKRRVPTVQDLAYLCANTFAPHVFSEMERHMLDTLEWDIGAPTAFEYVDLLLAQLCDAGVLFAASPAELPHHRSMAVYMCVCSLFDRTLIGYGARAVAAAAVELSCAILGALAGESNAGVRLPGTIKGCFDTLVSVIGNPPEQLSRRPADETFNVAAAIQHFFATTCEQSDDDWSSTCSTLDSPQSITSRMPRTPDNVSPLNANKEQYAPPPSAYPSAPYTSSSYGYIPYWDN